jgi:hypothetical protein
VRDRVLRPEKTIEPVEHFTHDVADGARHVTTLEEGMPLPTPSVSVIR